MMQWAKCVEGLHMVAGDNPLGCATRKTPLVVIMGASGTGKSTIWRKKHLAPDS